MSKYVKDLITDATRRALDGAQDLALLVNVVGTDGQRRPARCACNSRKEHSS